MAVFIRDVIKLGCRKLMIWTIVLIVECIQYAHAAKPTDIKLSVSGGDASEVPGTNTWKVDVTGGHPPNPNVTLPFNVTLTCAANGGHQYLFERNGMRDYFLNDGTWGGASVTIQYWFGLTDKPTAGIYTCRARGRSGMLSDVSPAIFLTLACTTTSDICFRHDMFAECDPKHLYCKCKLAKTGPRIPGFQSCFECLGDNSGCNVTGNKPRCDETMCMACDETTNAGCTDRTKPYCKKAGQACEACDTNGNKGCDPTSATPKCGGSGSCVACSVGFCSKIDNTTVCDTTTTGKDSGKCVAKITTSASDATTFTDAAPTTSSAGTVTSTVFVIIASVVGALKN